MKVRNVQVISYMFLNKTPNAIALKHNAEVITYRQLESKVAHLASAIKSHLSNSLGAAFIGVCMESCIDSIVTILAIIKAGFAYIPIDPLYPCERINYIIQDARLNLVITNSRTVSSLQKQDEEKLLNISTFHCLESMISGSNFSDETPPCFIKKRMIRDF